jgi:hypothetical protein
MRKLYGRLYIFFRLKGKDGLHGLFDFVVNIDLQSFIFVTFSIHPEIEVFLYLLYHL